MNSNPVKVLLVDDHRIFRDGIVSMFQGSPEVEICGLASNGAEAIQKILITHPDVVVLDLSMPGIGGLEVLKEAQKSLHKPEFLVLSMHTDLAFVKEAISKGAKGYICKEDTDRGELLEAIKSVAAGGSYYGNTIRELMQQQFLTGVAPADESRDYEPGLEVLSRRETEILKMVMEGFSNQEIADASFVSIRTVEAHKNNIMTKLNLKNTVELVKYAIRHKFFEV
jgi:DNA-binding NarL/FixJ family response regulator